MDRTTRGLVMTLIGLVVAALVFSLLMGGMMGPGMMGSPQLSRGWGWGVGMGIGGLAMLAFWGVLIVGVVLLVRGIGGLGHDGSASLSPTDILKQRYAKGEITRDEYEQVMKDLKD